MGSTDMSELGEIVLHVQSLADSLQTTSTTREGYSASLIFLTVLLASLVLNTAVLGYGAGKGASATGTGTLPTLPLSYSNITAVQ